MQDTISFAPQLGTSSIAQMLWLIPAVPILASGVIALLKQPRRRTASTLAIGSLAFSLLLSLIAFGHVLSGWMSGHAVRETVNFTWFQFGSTNVDLGWVLDPLSAVMLVMVTFVGLLIFIYSTGYMAHDENYMRFFNFLSLFAGAMLGVVIANSLLLLFMCWELVGLTSYLLIGFCYQKPGAAAAAKRMPEAEALPAIGGTVLSPLSKRGRGSGGWEVPQRGQRPPSSRWCAQTGSPQAEQAARHVMQRGPAQIAHWPLCAGQPIRAHWPHCATQAPQTVVPHM